MSKEISCSACFSKLSGPPIECELCHDPDTCYCSKQCRSALGWSQHQAECNVVHSKELVAVPYAWQNMTADWHEQQHKFPAYIVKDKLSPTSVQQTIVPSITKPASAASVASATVEQKTKAHSFYVEVNGVPLKRLQAPDAMISQYSGNAAAQHLASVRLPRTEGRTYWVASAAAAASAALKTNAVNEFRLVRGTGESEDVRVVRAHLVGNPVAHFEQQVGSRLGTGLRRFLKEQYKFKGLGSSVGGAAATGGATYYAVNPETRDTVTFTINKELQLVDLEFYAPKTQEPVSLQQETYETSFDDQDPTSVQALIMALTRIEGCAVENGTQNIRVLEEHHRRLSNPSANIEGDISHLIRVRTAVSESLSLLQEQQELIGKQLSKEEWTARLLHASQNRMMEMLRPWAVRLRQLTADEDAWRKEKDERSDFTAGRSLGFRKKMSDVRHTATLRSIKKLQDEIGVFGAAVRDIRDIGLGPERMKELDFIYGVVQHLQRSEPDFSDFPDIENIKIRKFGKFWMKGPRTEAEIRYFQEASRKPVGNPYSSRAAAPIGLWVQSPDDANQVIYFSGQARSDWDKSFLNKDGNEIYEAGDSATKADVLQTYKDLHPDKNTSEDQLIYKLDATGKVYTKRYESDASYYVQGIPSEEMKTLTNNFGKGTAPASEDTSKGVGGGGKEPDKGAGGGSKVGFDEYDDPVVGQGGGGGGGVGGGGAAAPAPKASSSWSKGYADSNPPDHPAGRRNYWYGQGGGAGDDDDFTIEELIACSFPENVMLNENFDWRTTPAVLSNYPEHVEALREQVFIGALTNAEVEKKRKAKQQIVNDLKKQLRKENRELGDIRKLIRQRKRGENQMKKAERQQKQAAKTQVRGSKTKGEADRKLEKFQGYGHHGDSWFDGDCYTSSEEEDEHRHHY